MIQYFPQLQERKAKKITQVIEKELYKILYAVDKLVIPRAIK